MLEFIYEDILKDNKQNRLTAINHFLASSAPRQLSKWLQREVRPLWYKMLFSFLIIAIGVGLFFVGLSLIEKDGRLVLYVLALALLVLGTFVFTRYFRRNTFVFALKYGVLTKGVIIGMEFFQVNNNKNGAYLYVGFTNKSGQNKVKKVFVDDKKIDFFKNILDSEEKPKIDLLEYNSWIAVPLIFCL